MAYTKEIYRSQSIEQSLTPPETPPEDKAERKVLHPWPGPGAGPGGDVTTKRRKTSSDASIKVHDENFNVRHQEVLLLHAPKERYAHTTKQPVPELENDREMLVAVDVVGLNPIDWKAPDFGFGLPKLPCISGRDLAGRVVKAPRAQSRFQQGDTVMAISTDYRDSRKSAYQQYAVVSDFNACRLPDHLSTKQAAPLGVAFAAAALALGICIGLDFGLDFKNRVAGPRGPNLFRIIHKLPRESIAEDVRAECYDGIDDSERPQAGDWLAIWGDLARSGERMLKYGADLLVDRLDPERAVSIVKSVTKGKLRFGLDTVGKESALHLARAMEAQEDKEQDRAHRIGLVGLLKESLDGVAYHSVPTKAFHEAPQIGNGLMIWLEDLLERKKLATPDIEVATGGLEGINAALDKLRDGSVNGPRIVVPLST